LDSSWNKLKKALLSQKQKVNALLSAEAEYLVMREIAKENLWLRYLLSELDARDLMGRNIYVNIDDEGTSAAPQANWALCN